MNNQMDNCKALTDSEKRAVQSLERAISDDYPSCDKDMTFVRRALNPKETNSGDSI